MKHVSETQINFDLIHSQPLLLVISGPSGVGKDATLQALKQRELPLHYVVTATTRAPREGEVHGRDYFFLPKEEFETMIAANELLEHAIVYEDYKGIPKQQIREAMASGLDVILRVDVQGAAKLRELCPDAVLIFLVPSSVEEWHARLNNRNSETAQSMKVRLETVKRELEFLPIFDYMVVNRHNCLEEAVDSIVNIISTEHMRTVPRKITL
ncbi:MAG: guanylate kinase [Chloroflexi bacterium HGW-Chloroflexi-10]|nr:MAG: guanylate kinase [Chloroflexi bacterium HGW-Chloroflexi-10]